MGILPNIARIVGGEIRLGPIQSTLAACPEPGQSVV